MAKRIITLQTKPSDSGIITVQAAFWLSVPEGQEIPQPSLAASAWQGANEEELGELQTGRILEEVRIFTFPVSYQVDDRHKFLEICYSDRATAISKIPFTGKYYGEYFDESIGWQGVKG